MQSQVYLYVIYPGVAVGSSTFRPTPISIRILSQKGVSLLHLSAVAAVA